MKTAWRNFRNVRNMKNDQEYEIRCVEADGHDYCCATFKSREVAEYNLLHHYKDVPLYEHYYICPAGVAEDIPSVFDED